MIDQIQAIVQPLLVDYLGYIILAAAAWFLRRLPEKWRVEIEQKHRDALHRALDTAVGLVIDRVQAHPSIAAQDAALGIIVDYVQSSVPDALKRLAPSRAHLERMARSRLQEAVDAAIGRDRLSDALKQAGAL